MSGVVHAVFGGGEQHQTSTPSDLTPTEYTGLRGGVADLLQQLISSGGFGSTVGQPHAVNTAPLHQLELQQLQQIPGQVNAANPLLQQTLAGNFVNPQSNPFLNQYIRAAQRPTLEGLTETLDRTLPGRFTQAGQFVQPQGSSAFDRAAAIATRGAANAVGDIATNIGYNAYNSERQLQQQAIGLNQQQVQQHIAALQAEALPRLIQQYGMDQGLQQYNQHVNQFLGLLQLLQTYTSPTPVSTTQGSQTSDSGIVPGLLSPFRFNR